MKFITHTITVFITLLLMCSPVVAQEMDHFQLQVDGLGCPFCAYGLEKKFKEFKGIKKVAIQIETGDFTFQYPSEKALSMHSVVLQVKKAGYTPKLARIKRYNGQEEVFTAPKNKEAPIVASELQMRVLGNCDMCKARIETAALSIKGVDSAIWDKINKQLKVKHNKEVSLQHVGNAVAAVGHDNEISKAAKEVYNNLPPCCTYRL